VGRCRLGTTVTKTVLLAWLNKDKEVCYKVLYIRMTIGFDRFYMV
jgi:hypothetical protein